MFSHWRAADFEKKYGWQKMSRKKKDQMMDSLKLLYGSKAYAKDGECEAADGTAGTDVVCHVGEKTGL